MKIHKKLVNMITPNIKFCLKKNLISCLIFQSDGLNTPFNVFKILRKLENA